MATGIAAIVLHAASLGFAVLALWRLYYYIKRYRFDETKYTLLFGFVHLRWIAIMYLGVVILWIPITFILLFRQ